ncbi:hypothetical protein [Roseovarius sp.]|uniref:hypothetical protein n=1 Tax=Roseovarius sp. TaxID=1486281 RepID=UPI00262D26F5|nr:hypothetical protein [Roseovarius sp.]
MVRHCTLNPGCHAIVVDLWVCNTSTRSYYDRAGARRATDLEIPRINLPPG